MSGLHSSRGRTPSSTPTLPVRVWLSSPATILLHSLVESVPHDLLLLLIAVGILTVTGTIFTSSAVITWYFGLFVVFAVKRVSGFSFDRWRTPCEVGGQFVLLQLGPRQLLGFPRSYRCLAVRGSFQNFRLRP